MPVENWLTLPIAVFLGLLLGELLERIAAYLPDTITNPPRRLMQAYQRFWYSLLPDWIFTWWYRYGVITAEEYKILQQQGCIENDLEPKYLVRRYSPAEESSGD